MSHRLLEKYPTLYQLCAFDLSRLKKQLSALTPEDISACNERTLIDRMDGAYHSLADEEIITSKNPSGKICAIGKALFISFPICFESYDGSRLYLYMNRTSDQAKFGGVFHFSGFGSKILPESSLLQPSPDSIPPAQLIKINRIAAHSLSSELGLRFEKLQHEIAESRMRAELLVKELSDLRDHFSAPIDEQVKLSLFKRLKMKLQKIIHQ